VSSFIFFHSQRLLFGFYPSFVSTSTHRRHFFGLTFFFLFIIIDFLLLIFIDFVIDFAIVASIVIV